MKVSKTLILEKEMIVSQDPRSKPIRITHPRWTFMFKEVFEADDAVAELLGAKTLMIGGVVETEAGNPGQAGLYVMCNDLFYWGCADYEPLPENQIRNLYLLWQWSKRYGPDVWCCMMRNMRPQRPIREDMKEKGFWPKCLDSCKPNPDEKT